jgi:carbonic anhydrase
MKHAQTLVNRNNQFAETFEQGELPILPKFRSVIITCGDARVDPAHILGLELGESVVIRNNGGRVTPAVIEELAAMSFMVAKMDGDSPGPFDVMIIQHTQCGAERFSDFQFQKVLLSQVGVDVSDIAIHNHDESIINDVTLLRNSQMIPDYVNVSGYLYDVKEGTLAEVITS